MLIPFLSFLTLSTALLHIRADYQKISWQTYLFKPATIVLIFLIACSRIDAPISQKEIAILVGLVFSLAGDIFLMLPSDRFKEGLVSFLLAHICYIYAFYTPPFTLTYFLLLIPFFLITLLIFKRLSPHLGKLKTAVLIYTLTIMLMGWAATGRWLALPISTTQYGMIGANLFLISDTTLAWNRFKKPFSAAQLIVLTTYYLAQWLIALSI